MDYALGVMIRKLLESVGPNPFVRLMALIVVISLTLAVVSVLLPLVGVDKFGVLMKTIPVLISVAIYIIFHFGLIDKLDKTNDPKPLNDYWTKDDKERFKKLIDEQRE